MKNTNRLMITMVGVLI